MEIFSKVYARNLVQWAKDKPEVLVLSADLTASTEIDLFKEVYPERFLSMGIAEQNMISFAGGLAREGFLPFIHTFGVFIYRRLIGILGILLPFICVIGGCLIAKTPIPKSISGYYYTNMRDFFVGLMFVVSLYLMTYKGYNKIDFLITTVTGLFGLGIAIFPCDNELYLLPKIGIFQLSLPLSNLLHLICAAVFLILLAINSLFLFTRSDIKKITKQKKFRNIVYIGCGIIILLSLVGVVLGSLLMTEEKLAENKLVLIFETTSLLAFGISWLVKGETIFKDQKELYIHGKVKDIGAVAS